MDKDSVKVYLRIRPSSKKEAKSFNENYVDQTKSTDRMIVINESPFTFHHIFYPTATSHEVFETMVSILIWLLDLSDLSWIFCFV